MKKKFVTLLLCYFVTLFYCSISFLYAQEELIINDFDQTTRWSSFHYKDEKGSIFNCSTVYKDKQKGNFLGIKYKIVERGYAGWGLGLKGLDVSKYDTLSIAVKVEKGNEKFEISIKDKSGNEKKFEISKYADMHTEWQTVKMSLSDFEGVNLKSLENFHIGFGDWAGKGKIYIDDIKFTSAFSGAEKLTKGQTRVNKVLIDGFERTNPYNRYFVYEGDDSSLNLASSRRIHEGDYSMEIEYLLSTAKPWGTWVAARLKPEVEFLNWSGVNEVKLWVYGDSSENILRFNIIGSDGEIWFYEDKEALFSNKWALLTMPIEDFSIFEGSPKVDGKLNLDKIKTFEISIISKAGRATPGVESASSKIYVDQLYVVGEDINAVWAAPQGIVEQLRVAIPTIGNVDWTGVAYTEFLNTPEERSKIFHWAKLAANAKVDKYSLKFEILAKGQDFGEAAYYTSFTTKTDVGTQDMGVAVSNLQLVANDPMLGITAVSLGNIWVDYTPYTFTPVWGYKGLTIEGDWDIFNYHLFLIKARYNSFSIGTRLKMFFDKFLVTGIVVYADDTAKRTSVSEVSQGEVQECDEWAIERIARDVSYTLKLRRKFCEDKLNLTLTYGSNKYKKYAEADYSDPFNPVFNQKLETQVLLEGEMFRSKIEINDSPLKGLNSSFEYRNVDTEFKPKFRQDPSFFDDSEADQSGYNIRLNQWYKRFVISGEYDYLKRKHFSKGYRHRLNFGIGYSGLEGMDLGVTQEMKRDNNNAKSSRSNFSALDRNEKVISNEFYVRTQLMHNLVAWFKIWLQEVENFNANYTYNQDSFQVKLEHYITGNAKFFAEYKMTHYPDPAWEPKGWPFDDNFFKVSFELTF